MSPIPIFSFSFLTLISLSFGLSLSPYNYLAHPLYELNHTLRSKYLSSKTAPTPVIVERYYINPNSSRSSTRGAFFLPAVGNYETFSSTPYFSSADVLFASGGKRSKIYMKVHLNRAARVSLLLYGSKINRKLLTGPVTVRGPPGWNTTTTVRSRTGKSPIVGDPIRHGTIKLPFQGVLVERIVQDGEVLSLPHPSFFIVNQHRAARFAILFSQVSSLEEAPVSFPRPEVPLSIKLPITGKRIKPEQVLPNKACPAWLHDIYVTKSREDPTITKTLKDLPFWRTWHPQIDPIYWCYFGHEHGAYPGPHKPMLGYTAWKTFDENGFQQRQDESHEGFKVFAFPLGEGENGNVEKFAVFVVHMHLAFARRFTTRFHTVSFAIWGGDDEGRLEAEFHMKMDFGPAKVMLANRQTVPADGSQEGILAELRLGRKDAGRRFNVLNIDDSYPDSVDKTFGFRSGAIPNEKNKKTIMKGLYEQWEGPLNTCTDTDNKFNNGFKFDVRDPGTAMRSLNNTTNANMQHLLGKSVNRFIVISSPVRVGMKYCWFDAFTSDAGINLELNDGVFYTDPFFRSVLKGPGKYSVRQYIMPEWLGVEFPKGHIEYIEEWNGWMGYSKKTVRMRSIEGAVDGNIN